MKDTTLFSHPNFDPKLPHDLFVAYNYANFAKAKSIRRVKDQIEFKLKGGKPRAKITKDQSGETGTLFFEQAVVVYQYTIIGADLEYMLIADDKGNNFGMVKTVATYPWINDFQSGAEIPVAGTISYKLTAN